MYNIRMATKYTYRIIIMFMLVSVLLVGCKYAPKPILPDENRIAPVIIEDDCVLGCDGVASPSYLFESAVTNAFAQYWSKDAWIERERGWVDLDNDGIDDLILSDPYSSGGTGGLGYTVYVATNGLYRAIGTIGGHRSTFGVEDRGSLGRIIWTYSHSSCCTGSFCWLQIYESETTDSGRIAVYVLDGEDSLGHDIGAAIRKWATVPIRWEISHTEDGKVSWRED